MSEAIVPTEGSAKPRGPRLPSLLGLAGLVPFWVLAVARVTGLPHDVPPVAIEAALAGYGATIISFLGGIRWGVALREIDQRRAAVHYLGSVVPQLIAWGALALPDPWRFAVLGLLIVVLGPIDRGMVGLGRVPAWFGRLRVLLSLGAGAALFLAALA